MPKNRKSSSGRDEHRGGDNNRDFISTVRERPYAAASAAAAAGVAAAAGAFLWSKRDRIGESFRGGMDRLSEFKSQRMGSNRASSEISEEALTTEKTGKKAKGPRGPIAQQDIKAGLAETKTSNQEAKAGAKAFS